jgi:hypothetical protein
MTSPMESGLYLIADKCDFHKAEVKYLWYIVGVNGIRMDYEKVYMVQNLEALEKLEELQALLGIANFY